MEQQLATEPIIEQVEPKPRLSPPLETWGGNERMRHIPSVEWIIRKVDADLRRRVEKLLASYVSLPTDDPRRSTLDDHFRAFCRAVDRLADVARHSRHNGQPPGELTSRVGWTLSHAVTNLQSVDPEFFGRRFPFHTFERSKAEPLYGSLLVAISAVERIVSLVRAIDPGLDERLLEGLVTLQNPVDERMLRPIA